jgi:hypothetical protein
LAINDTCGTKTRNRGQVKLQYPKKKNRTSNT